MFTALSYRTFGQLSRATFDRLLPWVYTVTARARYPNGSHWYMIVIARMKDGLVHRTTSFYAPGFPAPEWRAQWVERMQRPPDSA